MHISFLSLEKYFENGIKILPPLGTALTFIFAANLFPLSDQRTLLLGCDAKALNLARISPQTKSSLLASGTASKGKMPMATIYDFSAKSIDGKEIDFSNYKGDVLLIVNTASECGFTHQYQGLESLQKKFEGRGFKVLGFPCDQFGHQEPGDNKTIVAFCQKNYGVTFQLFDKIDVNGKNAHPLYKYLTSSAPGIMGSESIKWNFTKFLIDRKGHVVERFAPNMAPEGLIPKIEAALN